MALPLQHFLCIMLLLLIPHSTTAQLYKNISLGEFLIAGHDDSSWKSPSGEFAFGFQQIEKEIFLLAIYFNKLPEKTIAWSARTKNPVQIGSKVQLTGDGWFTLDDPTGNHLWKPDTIGAAAAYGAILDTGNFVLAGYDSALLWNSFDHPTDTLLPTQVLNYYSKLTARYSDKRFSSGRFELAVQSDGDLRVHMIAFPLESTNRDYGSVYIQRIASSGSQLIFNESGNIYLKAKNGSVYILSSNAGSVQDFYQRAILEYDGVFRHYVYPKNASIERWGLRWSTVYHAPDNICKINGGAGSGACGFNSYCMLGDDDDLRPICKCPRGYTFFDPNDSIRGCKLNFTSQNCDDPSLEVDHFDFEVMHHTDWPFSDSEHYQQVSEDWCRQACLADCFCAVVIFRNGDCWKKKMPLSNGMFDPASIQGKALIKIRKDDSSLKPDDKDAENKNRSTLVIVGSLLLSSSVFLNVLLLGGTFMLVFCFGYNKTKLHPTCPVIPGMNLRSFTYNELEKATNRFNEELGRGAFATVYKGILTFENRKLVAVKKLDNMLRGDKEFKAEVSTIGQTNHRNLVKLLGFCNEEKQQLLVYEFMSRGSLAHVLYRNPRPSWYQRMQIACGTARGLVYLHEECTTQIIHCDIKPQNILLDDSFTARISDFGLAKILKAEQTRTTTGIRGTKGYLAPEWFRNLPITVKVDVYSFGIVLLELICCRKNFEPNVKDENQMILTDWTSDCLKDATLHLLVENDEEALHDMERMKKYVMIAIWCIQEDPSLRPTMKKVTQMLEEVVQVSTPPNPSSFTSSNYSI